MFLGRKITKRCGNEGQHNDLEEKQATISYTSEATNMGADLSNGEFIFQESFSFRLELATWSSFFIRSKKCSSLKAHLALLIETVDPEKRQNE